MSMNVNFLRPGLPGAYVGTGRNGDRYALQTELRDYFRSFNAGAPDFAKESASHD